MVAYLALFVALGGSSYAAVKIGSAQIANNSVRSIDLRNNDVRGKDVRDRTLTQKDLAKGTLTSDLFKAGELPAAAAAPAAVTAPKATSAAGGSRPGNIDDFGCANETGVVSTPVSLTERSRIWAEVVGTYRDESINSTEVGTWARLRNAANTQTLATTVASWYNPTNYPPGDTPMSAGGLLFTGDVGELAAPPVYVADPGDYLLQLVIWRSDGTCDPNDTSRNPDFGFNHGSGFSWFALAAG